MKRNMKKIRHQQWKNGKKTQKRKSKEIKKKLLKNNKEEKELRYTSKYIWSYIWL